MATDDQLDLAVLLQLLGRLVAERVLDALAEHDVRESDGYVFQHLVTGSLPVTALAARLGVTQQAASKTVADLERRSLVARTTDPADARRRIVSLAPAGHAAVEAGRRARLDLTRELEAALGARPAAQLHRGVVACVEALGGTEVIRRRGFRAPT